MVDNEDPDVLDFSGGAGNAVLGAGNSDSGAPLFFTANQGLVAVAPTAQAAAQAQAAQAQAAAAAADMSATLNDSLAATERASSRLSESLSLSASRVGGLEGLTASESKSDQLKAAFLLFCKRNVVSETEVRSHLAFFFIHCLPTAQPISLPCI